MKRNHELDGIRLLLQIVTGNPVDAMEAAKRIVGRQVKLEPILLAEVASNRDCKQWSRLAAIYALGFAKHNRALVTLVRILLDEDEHPRLRCHAAEALGVTPYPKALAALRRVLFSAARPSIKQSCIYALSQFKESKAYRILRNVEATHPSGRTGKALRAALSTAPAATAGRT